jgi:hypothetical protein
VTALICVIHGVAALAVIATGWSGRLAHLLSTLLLELELVHDDDWRGSRRCNATGSRSVRDLGTVSRNEQQERESTGEGARSPMGDEGQRWWWCALGYVVVWMELLLERLRSKRQAEWLVAGDAGTAESPFVRAAWSLRRSAMVV